MRLYLMESQCKPRGMQSGNGVFAFIPEVPPDLGEAKVCKPRGMQSGNGVFAFIPEVPPDLGEAKVCKPRGTPAVPVRS